MIQPLRVAAIVFPGFEVLDLFGPIELLWMPKDAFPISIVAEAKGEVVSAQGVRVVAERAFSDSVEYDILLVPGGLGTRTEVSNPVILNWLRRAEPYARYVTSVCTGSALLAKAGLLDGRRATSNKNAFDWVVAQGRDVNWVREARWVEDGKYFTSSGVSAGMDMTLGFIERILDRPTSERVAKQAEYIWHSESNIDPFAR
jgi:putative intracellular protease/amidase